MTELLEKIDNVEKAKEPKALKPKKTYYKFILKKPLSKSRASMKWNECVYYDIETAPWNENFKNGNDKTYLDITNVQYMRVYVVHTERDIQEKDEFARRYYGRKRYLR